MSIRRESRLAVACAVLVLAFCLGLGGPALAKRGGVPAHGGPGGPPGWEGDPGPPDLPPGQAKKMGRQPPWAPTPGGPRHVYRYYPASGVYFDPGRGLWFWLEAGSWRSGLALPGGLALGGGFVGLTMGAPDPFVHHPQVSRAYPPGHRVKAKGGPPPWAPAHGRRAKYKYRYYPASQVYFDPGRGLWFWLEGGGWRAGVSLPAGLAPAGGHVTLGMEVADPYRFHADVLMRYPLR